MTIQNRNNYFSAFEKKLILAIFIILWIFLLLRAIYVPVLHDELATFYYYIQTDNYFPPSAHWDANNHILNSMLSNWSYHLFGSSPLALRLPNILSFLLFLYGTFQLASRLKSNIIRWGFLLAFVCSHYLFEYFGECRGYGMSMAFLVMAIYQFLKYREELKTKQLLLISFFLFLGTAANLTLILPSALIFFIAGISILFTYFKSNIKKCLTQNIILIFSALPFLLLVQQSFKLKEKGALYYGGDSGFYDFTVSSVTRVFTDYYNLGLAIAITLIFCGILFYLILQLIKTKSLQFLWSGFGFFGYLLVGTVLSILALSYILHVNFPEDRAGMHLFILFIGSFAFVLDDIAKHKSKIALLAISLFYFPLLFISHISLTKSVFSAEERTPYEIFEYVNNSPNNFKFPQLIGGYKTQEFCWYYMSHQAGGIASKIHTNYHIALDADFQLVRNGKITDSTLFDYYSSVMSDPATNLTLFERNNKLAKDLIYSIDVNPTNGIIEDEFHNIFVMDVDSLRKRTLYIGAEMTLLGESKPFISWLAVTINDKDGNSLYQEYIALDWLRKNWDGSTNNLLQGTILHQIPLEAKTLKFYIWNIDKTRFSIPNGKCYLYNIERDYPLNIK